MSAIRDYATLHFIVWIWGFTAILGALITIPSVEIVFLRTLIAVIALAFVIWIKGASFRIGKIEVLKVLGTGVIIALHWILFFGAARMSSVSVCLAGMATCSFWTSFVEPFFNRRKIRLFEVILGMVVVLGLYVIFRFEFDQKTGLFMAVISAFLAAVFSVINGNLVRRHDPYTITFYEMLGAFLGTAIFLPFYGQYLSADQQIHFNATPMDWFYLTVLAVICTVYAFSVSVELMKRLSAFVVNLTVNLEPVYGIVLAVIIFGEKERMQSGFYLGTLIILLSVLSYPVINKHLKRRAMSVDNLR